MSNSRILNILYLVYADLRLRALAITLFIAANSLYHGEHITISDAVALWFGWLIVFVIFRNYWPLVLFLAAGLYELLPWLQHHH